MTETSSKLSATENGDACDEILASIRSSLAASVPFDAARKAHHPYSEPVFAASQIPPPRERLIENFRTNLESVGGICLIASDETEATKAVADVIKQTGSARIANSDSEVVRRLVKSDAANEIFENASSDILFHCDIGITSAQWAIAETGTLVLESEKESHRLTSLVPPVHLCILSASSIRQTLGEILELSSRDLSRTITFITGASRTSDIELTLAIGVHGPKELYVIVIEDQ